MDSHQKTFERYVYAAAISRNPDAVAELFTEDGTYEAPLVPDAAGLPRRLAGPEAIRHGVVAYQQHVAFQGTVDFEQSGFVLHDTADPDVFIVELDTVINGPTGPQRMSLVQIFRMRDGRIASLRDYFATVLPED
ncbi:MAG TPA: nuclear transport factor 2 family protein [Actinoplanes sp.]|jgi:ketosteroid isomerase-like protein